LKETKVDVAHSEITRYWNEGGENLNKLLDYARKDAELPIKILFKLSMLDKFIEISKLSGINLQDCLDSGETQRIDSILLREFNRKNFVMPCKPDDAEVSRRGREREKLGLKGAFVLDPVLGFHDKCIAYLDYQSMYANIVISYNICPTTYLNGFADGDEYNKTPSGAAFVKKGIRRGILPEVLEYLLKMRSAIKKQMKNANDPAMKNYYYAKQYAFKTVGNAIYGYSGYVKSRLYVIDIANGITSVGREMTLKTKEIVETKTTYKVVYGDTDSCQVKFDTIDVQEAFKLGGQVSDLINREIKNILQIKIDSIFKSTLYLAKKRYAAWNFEPMENGWDESIMTKGIE
ncbi:MAG: hypothetical protein GW914_04460, partial [Candidatus Aenigmarchaeota archaeon]|nr:hypothetical protein [Candidatus Aenigmarchaeota archaeon]